MDAQNLLGSGDSTIWSASAEYTAVSRIGRRDGAPRGSAARSHAASRRVRLCGGARATQKKALCIPTAQATPLRSKQRPELYQPAQSRTGRRRRHGSARRRRRAALWRRPKKSGSKILGRHRLYVGSAPEHYPSIIAGGAGVLPCAFFSLEFQKTVSLFRKKEKWCFEPPLPPQTVTYFICLFLARFIIPSCISPRFASILPAP